MGLSNNLSGTLPFFFCAARLDFVQGIAIFGVAGSNPPGAKVTRLLGNARFSGRCDVAPPIHGEVVSAKPQKILESVNRNLTALLIA